MTKKEIISEIKSMLKFMEKMTAPQQHHIRIKELNPLYTLLGQVVFNEIKDVE